ncbi:MAG: nuclear transport factor 2 family protein [Acidimicrobiia bacterium]
MSDVSTDERLRLWLDKLEIREVVERYMRYNDDRRADLIGELFHDDIRFQVMGKVISGRDAVRAVFENSGRAMPQWTDEGQLFKQPGSVHVSSNPVIDVDGDTATCESDFLVVDRGADGRAKSSLVGRYRDEFRRVNGKWLIYTRTGVSVARPGEAGTDVEWARAFERMTPEDRSALRTGH